MGGHGGLNILPQKRWNVYNFDNREKVRLDEEAAAKEEQLKREQSRKRDTEFRVEKLRQARGLSKRRCDQVDEEAKEDPPAAPVEIESSAKPIETASDSKHINLFEGIKIFDPIEISNGKGKEKKGKFSRDENRNKKVKKEEVRVVGPEDEKYRLGYGVAGKGVKLPWYMEQRVADERNSDQDDWEEYGDTKLKGKRKICGKKTVEELREERLKREKLERDKERALLMARSKRDGGFSSRRR